MTAERLGYGSFYPAAATGTAGSDAMTALGRVTSRGQVSVTSTDSDKNESIAMGSLADHASIQSHDTHESAQAGVKRSEAIASAWDKTGLYAAYIGMLLVASATSLESQTTSQLVIFAASSFSAHSLVATVGVIQSVVLSVAKPPLSKIADVFGRTEALILSVLLYVLGYVQQAASRSVGAYAAAQVFTSAGATGLQILFQLLVADTSNLEYRALCSQIPQVPFLFTFFVGPQLAQKILPNWRWGYGIWAVVLPVSFLPLALSLILNQRKAAAKKSLPPSPLQGQSVWAIVRHLFWELDFFGLVLISAAVALILIPLTLAKRESWSNASFVAMLAVGVACLIIFPFWERSKTLAPRAFFPRALFKDRTVIVGIALAFFYFMAFYLSVYPYFQSYLLVVQGESVSSAGYIVQAFTFTITVTGIPISFGIKYLKRYKVFVVMGSIIYLTGLVVMTRYRTEGSPTWTLVATQIALGIGGAGCVWPAQLGVQASVTHQDVGAATAVFLTSMEIGGAVGNAISGAMWTNTLPEKLAQYLPPETQDRADDIFSNVGLAATGWPMGSATRDAINRAYQETMTKILTVAVFVAVPCVIFSFLMKNYKLDEVDQNVKGVVIGGTAQDSGDDAETEPLAGPSRRSWGSDDDEEAAIEPQEIPVDEQASLITKFKKRS